MAFDKWDWHADNVPEGFPVENGAVHIGVYFAWCANNDLISFDEDEGHEVENIEELKNREITGTQYFINNCDGKLWDVDFNEEGLEFTEFYYEELFFEDYSEASGDTPNYTVDDNWDIYDKVAPIIDKRFKEWKEQFS